ncbi:MAG TPA: DUF3592 domain-containing protein [Capsulimonadaceae bacterium]|jgi:hypothetical protein
MDEQQPLNVHTIEPELLRPAPRKIRKRPGHTNAMGCVQVFIIPHMLIAVGLIGYFLMVLAILLLGTQSTGHVVATRTYWPSGKSPHQVYEATVRYMVDGREYENAEKVPASVYPTLVEGTRVKVQYLAAAPDLHPILIEPQYEAYKQEGGLVVFALIWCSVMGVIGWSIYVLPVLYKRLIISGKPVIGIVTDKRAIQGKGTTYSVKYEFGTERTSYQSDSQIASKMVVNANDYYATRIGESVTVLYDERRPKINLIYRCADFEAIDAV